MPIPMQTTGTFFKYKMIDMALLHDFAPYSRQLIGFLKENVHVALGFLIKLSVNGKRAAIHTIFCTFREKSGPLFLGEPRYTFLETFEPISQFHMENSFNFL